MASFLRVPLPFQTIILGIHVSFRGCKLRNLLELKLEKRWMEACKSFGPEVLLLVLVRAQNVTFKRKIQVSIAVFIFVQYNWVVVSNTFHSYWGK